MTPALQTGTVCSIGNHSPLRIGSKDWRLLWTRRRAKSCPHLNINKLTINSRDRRHDMGKDNDVASWRSSQRFGVHGWTSESKAGCLGIPGSQPNNGTGKAFVQSRPRHGALWAVTWQGIFRDVPNFPKMPQSRASILRDLAGLCLQKSLDWMSGRRLKMRPYRVPSAWHTRGPGPSWRHDETLTRKQPRSGPSGDQLDLFDTRNGDRDGTSFGQMLNSPDLSCMTPSLSYHHSGPPDSGNPARETDR